MLIEKQKNNIVKNRISPEDRFLKIATNPPHPHNSFKKATRC